MEIDYYLSRKRIDRGSQQTIEALTNDRRSFYVKRDNLKHAEQFFHLCLWLRPGNRTSHSLRKEGTGGIRTGNKNQNQPELDLFR